MSERTRALVPYVLTLKSLSPKQRKTLIGYSDKNQIRAFEEVALNIVKGTTPLTPDQVEVCRKWKKPLKHLAEKRRSVKAKKQILQKGGFLGAILPILATVLGSVIGARNG